MQELSIKQARGVVLAAQGFLDPAPSGAPGIRDVKRVLSRVGLFQIDSVNVLARAHYLPAFSRLGPYRTGLIDDLAFKRRSLFEYWGHEASLLPIELFPYMRWKMDPAKAHHRYQAWAEKNSALVQDILSQVRDTGPLGVSDLKEPGVRQGPWWGWAEGKTALEWLFLIGEVTTAARRNFERLYDLTERVIPIDVLSMPVPGERDAQKHLLMLGARSCGVGTAKDIVDYHRLSLTKSRPLLNELVEEGGLTEVKVEGWTHKAYMAKGSRVPRSAQPSALVCPFDPLVWERSRTERLFGMRFRIEIYVPAPKRTFGYYVLPFLCDGELAARVDLKGDRKSSSLLVQAAHLEAGCDRDRVAQRLAIELCRMRDWLNLESIKVMGRGNLAARLRPAVRSCG